jgi:poly(A) polymerase
MKPSTLKKMMQRPTFEKELELHRIDCESSHGDLKHWEYLKHLLETTPPEEIKPPALISGHDVLAMGVPPGKTIARILKAVEMAQLDGKIQTRHEALALARKLAAMGMDTGQLPPPPDKPPDGYEPI